MNNLSYEIKVCCLVSLLAMAGACRPAATGTQEERAPADTLAIARQPAEFEEQEAVWVLYPPEDHLEGYSNEAVVLEIIEALLPDNNVRVAVNSDALYERARRKLPAAALESGRIRLLQIPYVEFWSRDMGPVFVVTEDGRAAIADFNFNAWGYGDTTEAEVIIEEKFDERVAAELGLPVVSSSVISEGGNREVNGRGTLMVVEAVELDRNPGKTKAELEAEFRRLLGVEHVIWLKEGLYEDSHTFLGPLPTGAGGKAYTVITTNGHIDEFARFAGPNTILLAAVDPSDLDDPIARENQRRMQENYEILKKAVDQDGRPFEIVRVPLPRTMLGTMKPGDAVYDYISTLEYEDGSTFPAGEPVTVIAAASYLNFLITNGAIIAQKYGRPGMDEAVAARDRQVKAILQEVFPGRRIVMIDALAVNFGGGGIHCITMQQPKIDEPAAILE
jgi:agmatine deiminase